MKANAKGFFEERWEAFSYAPIYEQCIPWNSPEQAERFAMTVCDNPEMCDGVS